MNIAAQRLNNQQLIRTTLHNPMGVVAWQGAMQAQEYALAKWGIALRLHGFTDAQVEQFFNTGELVRTHVMRPTWHFVAPADVRWLLQLTAARVHTINAYMYRKLELDDAIFRRSQEALITALQGGQQLMRTDIAALLQQIGIETKGELRFSYILMHAELEGVICSGARQGKQFTYALLEERVPPAKPLDRDQALAELSKRFFTSHAPATVQDFAKWSGLTVTDAKRGVAMNELYLVSADIDGTTYWHPADMPSVMETPIRAYLLPPYDELGIAYRDHSDTLDAAHVEMAKNATFGGVILINGRMVGNWRRTVNKKSVLVETARFRPFTTAENVLLKAAAQQFGDFLELPAVLA